MRRRECASFFPGGRPACLSELSAGIPFAGIHRPVVLYTVPQTFIEGVTVVMSIDGAGGPFKITAQLNERVAVGGMVQLRVPGRLHLRPPGSRRS
jgi:hypothetical protein